MSSPDINYPAQPSYGEGMAEAMKAQAEFLRGTGDFADVGSLESLLPLEESIRKKTAQTDTDILRQTLLGGETDTVTGTYDDQGRLTSMQSMDELVAPFQQQAERQAFEVDADDPRAFLDGPWYTRPEWMQGSPVSPVSYTPLSLPKTHPVSIPRCAQILKKKQTHPKLQPAHD